MMDIGTGIAIGLIAIGLAWVLVKGD